MVTILETPVSDESSSFSEAKISTMASSIAETIKSDKSEDASTIIHAPLTPPTEKHKVGNSLLRKFISTISKKQSTTDDDKEADLLAFDIEIAMSPPPFIRPLEHKLIPRQEPRFRPDVKGRKLADSTPTKYLEPTTQSSSLASISTQEIKRNRERTALILNGELEPDQPDITDLDFGGLNPSLNKGDRSEYRGEYNDGNRETEVVRYQGSAGVCEATKRKYGVDSLEYKIVKYHDDIATSAAQYNYYIPMWREYIECYTQGSYNMINPPFPPPCQEAFAYLPALFPPNELRRASLSEPIVRGWDQGTLRKTSDFVHQAMKMFNCRFAAMSWFDHGRELFQAEHGYETPSISRSISIAAHALLSHDVLVVLDTKEDWRFSGNPLVVDDKYPKIRFFAGAPMLSCDGQAIGVFSIFGKRPRKAFSPDERRRLADLAAFSLRHLGGNLDTLDSRATPILQRLSIINGEFHPVDSVPRFKVMKPLCLSLSPILDPRTHGNDAQTPPPTASDDGHHWSNSGGNLGTHPSLDSVPTTFPLLQDLITPISQEYDEYSPRPFSSSDITSINIMPANTPDNSLLDEPQNSGSHEQRAEVTVEEFLALSDEDCAEDSACNLAATEASNAPSSPLIDLSSPSNQMVQYRESQETESCSIDTVRMNTSRLRNNTLESFPKTVPGLSQASNGPDPYVVNACRSLAEHGFDLIYVVEVNPRRPNMSDKELLAPGGLALRVLAEYGRSQPLDLSPSIHLQALRARGGLNYGVEGFFPKDQDFENGYLIPVDTQSGPLRIRSGGVVLGAFRKAGYNGVVANRSEEEEGERLKISVEKLKNVLLRGTRFEVVSVFTDTNPYPANEAVEVGKSSFGSSTAHQSSGSQKQTSRNISRNISRHISGVDINQSQAKSELEENPDVVAQDLQKKYGTRFIGLSSISAATATHKRRRHFE